MGDVNDVQARFRIGQRCTELETLLGRHGAASAALLSAYNPLSVRRELTENMDAHSRLLARITADSRRAIPARAYDDRSHQPGEPSVLVLPIALGEAVELALAFGQRAIVFIDEGNAPRVVAVQ